MSASAYNEPRHRVNALRLILAVMLASPNDVNQVPGASPMARLVESHFITQLIDSLLYDTGNHLFPLGLRAISLVLPYAPLALTPHTPHLMVILGRALCWRVRPFADADKPSKDTETRTPAPLTAKKWRLQSSAMEAMSNLPSTLSPDAIVRSYLTSLYGAWPSNVIAFIRDPGSYLDSKQIPLAYDVTWAELFESGLLARRIDPLLQDFRLHPTIIYFTSAAELADSKRWEKLDPMEIIARAETLARATSGQLQSSLLWSRAEANQPGHTLDNDRSLNVDLRTELQYSERTREQYIHCTCDSARHFYSDDRR